MSTIRWSGTPEELEQRLAELPEALAGRRPDTGGAVRWLAIRVGLAFMSLIRQAFVIKSEGGTDAMGIHWPVLASATLALRRIVSGAATTKRLRQRLAKLTPAQRRQVERHARRLAGVVYRSPQYRADRRLARHILDRKVMRGEMSRAAYNATYKRLAGKLTLKKARQEVLAGAFALILRDKGGLLNSLSPVMGAPGQVLNVGPGFVEIGSNIQTDNGLPLLALHNSSKPRKKKKNGRDRLPRRQVLPDSASQIPPQWWQQLNETLRRGMASREFLLLYLGGKAS